MPRSCVVGPVNSFFNLLTPSQYFLRTVAFFKMSERVTLMDSPTFIWICSWPTAAWPSRWTSSSKALSPALRLPCPTFSCDPESTRNQSFTYDLLNRLTSAQNAGTNCAATSVNGKTEYWGNNYGYDAWGNLLAKTITQSGAENLSLTAAANNQLQGSYTYDADGNRVKKATGSTGTLYWYMTPGIVAETDLSGALKSEYVFFDGERVARRDGVNGAGGVFYYFSDHLKTASVITDSAGNIKSESDYYPWGGELQFTNNDSNHYKFTGKERDTETQLDYFGARYYSNGLGRFVTPDWSAVPVPVPYADLTDPQSLNQYTYVRNIPTTRFDLDGHGCPPVCDLPTPTAEDWKLIKEAGKGL